MAKIKTTADIRRFTGFLAPDGSTHDSMKKATDYTRDLKIKKALADFALVMPEVNKGVSENDHGNAVIYSEDLPEFLLAHKEDILAAFNQDVLMRAPRTTKVKAMVEPTTAAASLTSAAAAIVVAVPVKAAAESEEEGMTLV